MLYTCVSAPPVLPDNIVDDHVTAQLGKVSLYSLKLYSLSDVNITLSPYTPSANNSDVTKSFTYQYAIHTAVVKLLVYDKEVDADGFNAIINLTISSKDGFGEYSLKVSNSVGATTTSIRIVPIGR